jgi:nickel/cobalt exporter
MVDALGSATGLGVLGAAAVLGVTHALEPDHAAGISALTSETDRWTHAAFVGGSFAVGHVAVVVAWVAVLGLLGAAASSVPGAVDEFGTVVVGGILVVVAAALAATGAHRLRASGDDDDDDADGRGIAGRLLVRAQAHLHSHSHETRTDYLRTGVVGSLFALSPPVSMLALVSAVLPSAGLSMTAASVGVYAVAITATMCLVGTGLGGAFAAARRRGRRTHAALELAASAVVFGFAVQVLA